MTPLHEPSIIDDVRYIIRNPRHWDGREIAAVADWSYILETAPWFWESARFKEVFYDEYLEPVAFITFHQSTPTTLVASMITTERWRTVSKKLLLWGLKFFKPQALDLGYRRVECRTLNGHAAAHEMLERLGFRHEACIPDYGLNGELFQQFAWRLSDHVHLLRTEATENAGPAGGTPERGRRGQP